jgi:hypothetical protein
MPVPIIRRDANGLQLAPRYARIGCSLRRGGAHGDLARSSAELFELRRV